MNWVKDLYTTPTMEKKKIRIKWKINHRAGVLGVYLLILPVEENNAQLEIINGSCLKQKACYSYYNSKKMAIIGIAESQYSANEIVLQIVNESVKNTGDADIKSYLLEKYRNELQ